MRTNIFFIGLLALAIGVVSCARKISPADIAKAKQTRLEWNLKTLAAAYQDAGNTDSKWDEFATNALIEFARSRSRSTDADEDWATIIATNSEAAVKAGCDDPMVRYLYIKFSMNQTNSPKDFSDAFCKVEADMEQSGYPPLRKFYASLRAQQQLYYAFSRTNRNRQLAFDLAQHINDHLVDVVSDKATPPEEVYEACSEGLYQMSGSEEWYTNLYNRIEKPLFANWPNESISWLLKGEVEIKMAWLARGSGYADTVSEQGWKSFRDHLKNADDDLNRAWKLNPKDERIPRQMITVELGQGKGRDRMELWFNRAMTLNPNYYDACNAKLYYLEPKWFGSTEDMLEFGHECATNIQWGGNVPLILLDAHLYISQMFTDKNDQENYWKRPDVWPDLEMAYERFFEVNPNASGRYYQYAWYAYKCDQFQKFLELIPRLGKQIDYSYFGGKEEFDKMVQLAKEHSHQ